MSTCYKCNTNKAVNGGLCKDCYSGSYSMRSFLGKDNTSHSPICAPSSYPIELVPQNELRTGIRPFKQKSGKKPGKYPCPICGKKLRTLEGVETHRKVKH